MCILLDRSKNTSLYILKDNTVIDRVITMEQTDTHTWKENPIGWPDSLLHGNNAYIDIQWSAYGYPIPGDIRTLSY